MRSSVPILHNFHQSNTDFTWYQNSEQLIDQVTVNDLGGDLGAIINPDNCVRLEFAVAPVHVLQIFSGFDRDLDLIPWSHRKFCFVRNWELEKRIKGFSAGSVGTEEWVINSEGIVKLCLELEIITEEGLMWRLCLLGTILSRRDGHFLSHLEGIRWLQLDHGSNYEPVGWLLDYRVM